MTDLTETLSADQRRALTQILAWHEAGGWPPLTLGGLAGTGKTSLICCLPQFLPDIRIAFAAYTGKATSVLRRKLPGDVPPDHASTLHRLLYRACEVTVCTESDTVMKEADVQCRAHAGRGWECAVRRQLSFTPAPEPLAGIGLVVADEASMIPEQLWKDLTGHGVPVLAVGDHGQLPPVRSSFNLMASPDIRLEKIHRQNEESPSGMAILTMARWAREQGHVPPGWYGPDAVKLTMAEHESGLAGLHPAEADLIICATNAARTAHNQLMRAWHGRSGPPQVGDTVTCLRNNHAEGLYNGQRGTILAVGGVTGPGSEATFQAVIECEDLLRPWSGTVSALPFGDPKFQASCVRDRHVALFDYGYALTAHKAQGSSAEKVLVIEEGWPAPGTGERSRWLYTAVTRAERSLTIAGW
jgi:exodeoxyribonuclease-5